MTEPDLLARVEGSLGHLTLNRPRQLNALNPSMVEQLRGTLRDWADDPRVSAVLIDGAGDRGFCAGGDVKLLYQGIVTHSLLPFEFWAHEYEMNAAVAEFPKPYVAFMDGICFGGGLGVSVHGSIRIVTERSQLAMPETAIGLAPDVGALYWYARMPGGTGTFAALTGARLNAGDAISGGLADFCCRSTDLGGVVDLLRRGGLPDDGIGVPPPPPSIGAGDRAWIDECFIADTLDDIATGLAHRPEPAAARTLQLLRTLSPTSVKVTLAAIRRAATLPTIRAVLGQDLLVSSAFTRHPDLAEGIRALLVDKDRQPRWNPALWEDVSDADVETFFQR